MNRRNALKLALGLGLGMTTHSVLAADKRSKLRETRYPSLFYTFPTEDGKEPGIRRIRLDNRTLEITVPGVTPDEFFMPEAVISKGKDETFHSKLRHMKNRLMVLGMNWQYGLFDGTLGTSMGGVDANIEVKEHTEIWVKDPNVTTQRSGYTFKGERPVELDYFKLSDFIQAVHSVTDPDPHWVEMLNGRRWVRQVKWRRDNYLNIPLYYEESFYTPLDRRRILKVAAGISYSGNYDIPDGMPGWMRRLSSNITAVLRSTKLSPPDDGSPDPFLIDPEQKTEAEPVTFPAPRRGDR